MDISELKVGDIVLVSDGKPQPPARHTKKLTEWRFRNFTGTVTNLEPKRNDVTIEVARGPVMRLAYVVKAPQVAEVIGANHSVVA